MNTDNKMNYFIEKQFSLLPQLLNKKIEINNLGEIPKTIVFVGSGSSLNAARISERYFRSIGRESIFFLSPNQYFSQSNVMKKHLMVAVSQTGTSIATISALETAKKLGNPTILISATKDSQKRNEATLFVDLCCEEEKIGPKTVGFGATIVRLIQLAVAIDELSGGCCDFIEELKTNLQLLPLIKVNTKNWILMHQNWAEASYITVAADESFKAVGDEGALKLLETLRIPVPSYEIGEFTHGSHRLIHEGSFHIYLGVGAMKNLTKKVADYSHQQKAQVLYLSFNKSDIDLAGVKPTCGVEIVISLVFQVLANELAMLGGFNPDEKVHPNFFRYIGTKD